MRHITFNGVSTKTLGITVASGDIGQAVPRIITQSVPYKDGAYDFSRLDGSLHYDNRTLTYVFNITDDTAEMCVERLNAVLSWIYTDDSEGDNVLRDDNFGSWIFTGVHVSDTPKLEIIGSARRAMKLTVTFTANPYMSQVAMVEAYKSSELGNPKTEVLVLVNPFTSGTMSGGGCSAPKVFAAKTSGVGTYNLAGEPDFEIVADTEKGYSSPHWKHERTNEAVFGFPLKDTTSEFVQMGENCGRLITTHYVYQSGTFIDSSGAYDTAKYYSLSKYDTSYFNSHYVTYSTKSKTLETAANGYRGFYVEFENGFGTYKAINTDDTTSSVMITTDGTATWTAYVLDVGGESL